MTADTMRTVVGSQGQTVVPASIRYRHGIQEGDALVWLDGGDVIRLIHVRGDAIDALRGSGRGEAVRQKLLVERTTDRKRNS